MTKVNKLRPRERNSNQRKAYKDAIQCEETRLEENAVLNKVLG